MRLFQLSSFKLPPLCMHLWVCSGAAFWGESPAPPCRAVQLLQGFLERGCARGSVWEEVPERSKPSGGSISLQKSQLGRFHSERKSCREPELFGGAWCLKEEQTNRTNNKKKGKVPGGTRGQWVLCTPASPPVNLRTVWSLVPNLDSGAVRPEDPQRYPL